jgi:dipeptidyl aminopeptidase/acylaminoacyl peptidase
MRDIRATSTYQLVERWIHAAEDPALGRVSQLAQVAPSPDGRFVAAIGAALDSLASPYRSVACLVEVATGVMRELGPASADALPAWSSDSGRVLYAEGGRLVCVDAHDPVSGPASVELPGRVESVRVSPGGDRVLVVVAPEDAERAGSQGSGADGSATEPSVDWLPEVRSVTSTPRRRCMLIDLATWAVVDAPLDDLNVWEADWRDDEILVAIASQDRSESGWYRAELVSADLTGGEVASLHVPVGDQLGQLVASGGVVAIIEAICSDRLIEAGDVLLIDHRGQVRRVDTHGVDVCDLSACGGSFGYVGLRGLDTVVGLIDASDGTAQELWASEETFTGFLPRIGADATGGIYGVLESYDRYPELVTVNGDGMSSIHRLAHAGTTATRARAGRIRSIRWPAVDGLEMQGLLVLPDGDGPHPLVVNIHGGPVGAWRNRWGIANGPRYPFVGLLASLGFATLYVNPRGSCGRGRRFTSLVRGDMNGADTGDFLSAITYLVDEGIADPDRIGLTGNSYGGMMSCWLLTRGYPFAAAVPTSPVTDLVSQHYTTNIPEFDRMFLNGAGPDDEQSLYRQRSSLTYAGKVSTPTLLIAGLQDRCTPPGQAVEFYQALVENGVETELVLYPRQGHGVVGFPETIDFIARMIEWFLRYMPPDEVR